MNTDRELMQQARDMIARADMQHWSYDHDRVVLAALDEKLAQPVQEPVNFKCTVIDDANPNGVPLSQWGKQQKQKPFCYHDGRNIVGKEYAHHCDVFPLYTHPAAQQPLTDEQFNRIPELYVIPPHHVEMVVRAIEAAHGIGEKPDAA